MFIIFQNLSKSLFSFVMFSSVQNTMTGDYMQHAKAHWKKNPDLKYL